MKHLTFCSVIMAFVVIASIALYFDHVYYKENITEKISVQETSITETDVYRMSCTEIKDNVCTEYVLKRINKE